MFVLVNFHQKVKKARKMAWHDLNIKNKTFPKGYMVFYDSKYLKEPGK